MPVFLFVEPIRPACETVSDAHEPATVPAPERGLHLLVGEVPGGGIGLLILVVPVQTTHTLLPVASGDLAA